MITLVALSAAYGAAGSRVGPALAERLGVPFVDRAIALAVAEQLDVPVDEAVAQEDAGAGGGLLQRLLAGFAAGDTTGLAPLAADATTSEDFHRATSEVLLTHAQSGRGVILGRGAVAALRDDPRALRVRLTGPPERRVERALRLGIDLDRPTAERAMRRLDRAHAEYLQQFYGADIDDPCLYHLMIDATAFPEDVVVDLILAAAAGVTAAGAVAG